MCHLKSLSLSYQCIVWLPDSLSIILGSMSTLLHPSCSIHVSLKEALTEKVEYLQPQPEFRPLMSEVVQDLQRLLHMQFEY